jgi:hypothetical protein
MQLIHARGLVDFLHELVRVGGLRLCSRNFNRQWIL